MKDRDCSAQEKYRRTKITSWLELREFAREFSALNPQGAELDEIEAEDGSPI